MNIFNDEEWRVIIMEGEETLYEVSNKGNIRDRQTGLIIPYHLSDKGYCRVYLRKSKLPDSINRTTFLVHRLVLMAFNPIDNPDEMTGDHINKDKLNNELSNLRWLTREDNSKESHKFGRLYGRGMDSNHRIYSLEQILAVCELLQENEKTIPKISELTGVKADTINKIKSKREWENVSCDFDTPDTKPNENVKVYSKEMKESMALYIADNLYMQTSLLLQNMNMEVSNANRMLVNRIRNDYRAGKYNYLFTGSTTIESVVHDESHV